MERVAERFLSLSSEELGRLASPFRTCKFARAAANRSFRSTLDMDGRQRQRRRAHRHALHKRAAHFPVADIAESDSWCGPAVEKRRLPFCLRTIQARRQADRAEQCAIR